MRWLLSLAIVLALVSRAHADCKPAPADPVDVLVQAAKVGKKAVSGAQLFTAPGGSVVALGVVSRKKARDAVAVYLPEEQGQRCLGKMLSLGSGRGIRVVGTLDLEGPPGRINLQLDFDGSGAPAMAPGARFPALLLEVTDESRLGRVKRGVLLSLSGTPRELWSYDLDLAGKDGGGFSTIELTLSEGTPRDLEVVQTSLPRKGDRQYRPGPPLRRTFHYQGDAYAGP